jgi:Domain of unknown function (DUF4845)
MTMKQINKEYGISLVGLIIILAIAGFIFVLLAKMVPAYSEFYAIKRAIVSIKDQGRSVPDFQRAFSKYADAGYITTVKSTDLNITKNANGVVVISVDYEKRIELPDGFAIVKRFQASTDQAQ